MNSSLQTIIKQLNLKQLETQIALQCAPVVLGIKVSNLLIIDRDYKYIVKYIFYHTPLSYYQLYEFNQGVAFLVFSRSSLTCYLKQELVQRLFWKLGYQSIHLGLVLREVSSRLQRYIRTRENFPHELGLLLGYPPKDVNSFIQKKGRDYLYSGYWKVYHDAEGAKRIFDTFDQAKALLLTWIFRGGTIRSVIAFRHELFQELKTQKNIPPIR